MGSPASKYESYDEQRTLTINHPVTGEPILHMEDSLHVRAEDVNPYVERYNEARARRLEAIADMMAFLAELQRSITDGGRFLSLCED